MNNYINNNEEILNNNNYHIQENEKINNSTIVNTYKVNSLSSQKNLTQMINGINDRIGEISSQIRDKDDKIENYINKNYSKNIKTRKNISLNKKMLPRPRSQAKKFLSINNSTISKIKRKKDNHTKTEVKNITNQSEKINSNLNNSNDKSNGNSNNSTHNIITSNINTNTNNNIINYNLTNDNINNNSIFNKSLNNYNNKNPLKLSHSKLRKDSKEINKKLNSSYTENYISINNNFLNNNEKYLYRVPAKTKPKELILLNEVLQKQIIEVRLQLYEANKKIEDDANIIKNLKNENNNLLEENKIYESKLNELAEIYNYDKNYNLNEMESQNRIITQMDMEISQLNNAIKEKDELILSLKEQINLMFLNKFENNNDKNININGNINSNITNSTVNNNNKTNKYSNYSITKLGTFKNYKTKTDINSLKEEFEQLINNKNISQNIKTKEDNYNGKTEGNINTNFSPLENNLLNTEVNNQRKTIENSNFSETNKDNINSKMKALIKENKKINDLYNKLKIEYDNLSNNINDDFVKMKEENILLQKKLKENKNAIEQLTKTNSDSNVKTLEYETEMQQNKIEILKLKNEITSLKEDKNNLSILNKQISEINNKLKSNNSELVKENNQNLSQIKELESLIKKDQKTNLSNVGEKIENELKQKIKSLEENKLNLEKKIIEYENQIQELKEKNKMSDMSQEINDNKNKIINENEKMKNEIISLKEQIAKFKNEVRSNAVVSNKLKEAEDKINLMKKENEKNLNELNIQQKKNQELIEIINKKKNNLQSSIDIEGDQDEEEEEYENQGSSDSKGGKRHKNKKNEQEQEIDKLKKINELLTKDNSIKEEKIKKLMNNLEVSKQEQSYILIIETLKKQIKENENTINDLTIKNKELNDLFNNNNIPISNKYINKKKNKFEKAKFELKDDIENNNNYHSENRVDNSRLSRISNITSTSVGLTDQERIDKYKKKLKEYKKEIELHLNQINILKEEIRKLNHRLNNPIFQNYDEFIKLFQIIFGDYKPNKKEQKEAYEQFNQKFGLFNISNI